MRVQLDRPTQQVVIDDEAADSAETAPEPTPTVVPLAPADANETPSPTTVPSDTDPLLFAPTATPRGTPDVTFEPTDADNPPLWSLIT